MMGADAFWLGRVRIFMLMFCSVVVSLFMSLVLLRSGILPFAPLYMVLRISRVGSNNFRIFEILVRLLILLGSSWGISIALIILMNDMVNM